MRKPTVHVTPNPKGGRQTKIPGTKEPTVYTKTQKDGISYGKTKAIIYKTELIIHGKDGKIRDKDSYGPDKFPPRG